MPFFSRYKTVSIKLAVLSILILTVARVQSQPLDGYIKGSVFVSTTTQTIKALLTYEVFDVPDTASVLRFLFASENQVDSVSGKAVKRFEFDTVSKPGPSLVIFLEKRRQGRSVKIALDYSIPIDTARYRFGIIELGLDWMWFPVHASFSAWRLRFDLDVNTDEAGLELYSNGEVKKKGPGVYKVASAYTDFDIDLFFFRDSRVYTGGSKDVKVVGDKSNPLQKDSIAREADRYLKFYRKNFGQHKGRVTAVFRPQFKDKYNFGYSRQGYFVLQEQNKVDAIKFHVAHEIAHFWFITGETTENGWLTESLAEYAAMLAMKQYFGDSVYNSLILDKNKRLDRVKSDGKTMPSMFNNGSKNKTMFSQMALYHRGPLFLHQLAKAWGEGRVIDLMKLVYDKKLSTTDEVIQAVKSKFNREEIQQFLDLMKEY